MTLDEVEKIKTVVENKNYIVELVNTVTKVIIEAFENIKIEDVNMFQLGYNKAIDDFVEELKDYFVIPHDVRVVEIKAKQLKGGGVNEMEE